MENNKVNTTHQEIKISSDAVDSHKWSHKKRQMVFYRNMKQYFAFAERVNPLALQRLLITP